MARRYLCLHGMYQNHRIFENKIKHLDHGGMQLVHIDGGVLRAPKIVRNKAGKHSFRTWWPPGEDNINISCLLHSVLKEIDKRGWSIESFDGVLGFSQGAVMASILCSTLASEMLNWTPKSAIMISGYLHGQENSVNYNVIPHIRTMHVYGKHDQVIVPCKSKQLANLFTDPVCYSHHQGHIVPTDLDIVHKMQQFMIQ